MATRAKRDREAARRGAAVPRHSRTIPNGKEGQTCFPVRNGNQGLTFFPIRSETFGQTFRLIVAWDPTEPVATRPLVLQRQGGWNFFYTHDMRPRRRRRVARRSVATEPRSGRKRPRNKNVSDVVSFQQARGVPAHYEYAPFGAVTAATTNTAFTAFNVAETNPYRFSSEYADDTLGLVYYNYRHYEPLMGRWVSRDPLDADNQYVWCYNRPCNLSGVDVLGLTNEPGAFGWDNYSVEQRKCCNGKPYYPSISCCRKGEVYQKHQVYTGVSYFCMHARWWYQTIIRIRPFSTRQFALTHCWLNVDGNRFGAYPNGGPLKKPQSDGQSIQDDDHHAEDEDAWYTSRTDVNLSPCQYDIEVFKNCMAGKRNATWMWTAWNNCGDFVEAAVTDCTNKAQYDK